jgi:hypothetical protein
VRRLARAFFASFPKGNVFSAEKSQQYREYCKIATQGQAKNEPSRCVRRFIQYFLNNREASFLTAFFQIIIPHREETVKKKRRLRFLRLKKHEK